MFDIILSFITAFTLCYFSIPAIINVAREKNLMDEPGERRSHKLSTPSLGGVAIFASLLFGVILWIPFDVYGEIQYVLCALVFIFLIGVKDDLVPMPPREKLIGQLISSAILVLKADVRLFSFQGVFGIHELPPVVSVLISIFLILVIINAFNLIDGINGLSGSIGLLICMFLGVWFLLAEEAVLAMISFTAAGSILAFLHYNFRSEIFMGDTGAMIIGMMCAVLTLEFIQLCDDMPKDSPLKFSSVPAVALGLLILPLFDTLRVFVTRILRGRSPLYPDRSHIHHLLIDFGFSHAQATISLVVTNMIFLFLIYELQWLGTVPLMVLTVVTASSLSGWLYFAVMRKRRMNKRAA